MQVIMQIFLYIYSLFAIAPASPGSSPPNSPLRMVWRQNEKTPRRQAERFFVLLSLDAAGGQARYQVLLDAQEQDYVKALSHGEIAQLIQKAPVFQKTTSEAYCGQSGGGSYTEDEKNLLPSGFSER